MLIKLESIIKILLRQEIEEGFTMESSINEIVQHDFMVMPIF